MTKVSVVMPVYNCVAYIKESVASILTQTFTDFEFFIIDDHSTDGTYEYLQTLTDARIQLIRKPQNSGYTVSLNMGLDLAKGEYIARMDGDDIALPERFAKQVIFMDNNLDVVVCGSSYQLMGTDTIISMPVSFEATKVEALMNVPVAHPTVFIRRNVLIQHQLRYNPIYEPTEDYDLWTRILEIGKIENLPGSLLLYRKHSQQESITKYNRLIEVSNQIRKEQLNKILSFQDKCYDILFSVNVLTRQSIQIDKKSLKKIIELLTDIHAINLINKNYNGKLLYNFLRSIWLFYIAQFSKSQLKDISILSKITYNKLTRLGVHFYFQRLIKFVKRKISS